MSTPKSLLDYRIDEYKKETNFSSSEDVAKYVKNVTLELSNIDFKANATYWQEANTQLDLSGKIMSQYKQLLQSAMELLS